jgi:hypothetical protein
MLNGFTKKRPARNSRKHVSLKDVPCQGLTPSSLCLFANRIGKRNEARQVAMYLIRKLCKKSLKEIAQSFSLGSYGSVGGACSLIERQIKVDRKLRRRIEQIREIASSTSIQKKT